MPKAKLTDIVIRNIKPPDKGQIVIWDKVLPNFGVRVSQGGTRSYVVMLYEGKRRRRITLGKYPALGLAEARTEAKKVLAGAMLGTLPDRGDGAALNFTEALKLFVEIHCAKRNRPGTAYETTRLLRRHFEPKLGNRLVKEISNQDVVGIIDRMLNTPSEANHAFAAIRKFFNWAKERQYISHSPCEGMHLPTRPKSRERVLSNEEVSQVFLRAQETGYPYGSIVMLLLLTGQRRQEITTLRWDDIDLGNKMITVPAERNKSNRPHVVPFAPMAFEILEKLPRLNETIFPARGNPETTYSGFSKAKRRFDMQCDIPHWTLHDLRRTVATHMAGLGVQPHIVERILNHSTGAISGVAAIYNRFGYIDEMRAALTEWEEKVASLCLK